MGCSFHCVSLDVWQPTSIPPYLTLTFSFHNISSSSEDRRRKQIRISYPNTCFSKWMVFSKHALFSPRNFGEKKINSPNLTWGIFWGQIGWGKKTSSQKAWNKQVQVLPFQADRSSDLDLAGISQSVENVRRQNTDCIRGRIGVRGLGFDMPLVDWDGAIGRCWQ